MASSSTFSAKHLPTRTLPIKPTDAINNTYKPNLQTSNPSRNDALLPSQDDLSLSMASHLTHRELLRRRLRRLRRLSKVYRDHYWALMEDLRVHYREYYWKYGVSPYKEEDEREIGHGGGGGGDGGEFCGFDVEGCGESNNNNNGNSTCGGKLGLGLGYGENVVVAKLGGNNQCAFVACKLKAMALTSFCHLHILFDPQQKLYKACNYIIKTAPQGPILCGKPILKTTVPSLCKGHFPKARKDVKHALKKAGLNVSSSSKLAPKFHVLVAEYVHLIQSKRRAAEKLNKNIVIKEESTS